MKSIPAALTWELVARDRWALAAAALTALGVPAFIFTALKSQGGVDPDDPSMFIMHIAMVQLNIVAFGGAVIATCFKLSPLYPLPITNAALAACRLAPAMALLALETIVWTAALNGLFDLNWPHAGPAFLSAVALAAVLAALWLTTGSRWGIFGVTLVATVLGFWMKSRYGPMFGQPTHAWHSLTLAEGLTLAVFAAFACGMAVIGVARSRCGERPFSLGLADWLDRMLVWNRSPLRASSTPAGAHFWYAWQHGWLMPAAVGIAVLVGLTIWLFASRDPRELVLEFPTTCWLLTAAALLGGLAFGNVGARDTFVMGPFLATRPIATADMARAILRAAAVSLALAWAVWFIALALVFGALFAAGVRMDRPNNPGLLLSAAAHYSWIFLGVVTSLALTGRIRFLLRLFCALAAVHVAIVATSKYTLPPHVHFQVMNLLVIATAIACTLTTLWIYAASLRRGLISVATLWTALAVAIALLVICAAFIFQPLANWTFLNYAVMTAFVALTIAPLAAAPLALTYNRIR